MGINGENNPNLQRIEQAVSNKEQLDKMSADELQNLLDDSSKLLSELENEYEKSEPKESKILEEVEKFKNIQIIIENIIKLKETTDNISKEGRNNNSIDFSTNLFLTNSSSNTRQFSTNLFLGNYRPDNNIGKITKTDEISAQLSGISAYDIATYRNMSTGDLEKTLRNLKLDADILPDINFIEGELESRNINEKSGEISTFFSLEAPNQNEFENGINKNITIIDNYSLARYLSYLLSKNLLSTSYLNKRIGEKNTEEIINKVKTYLSETHPYTLNRIGIDITTLSNGLNGLNLRFDNSIDVGGDYYYLTEKNREEYNKKSIKELESELSYLTSMTDSQNTDMSEQEKERIKERIWYIKPLLEVKNEKLNNFYENKDNFIEQEISFSEDNIDIFEAHIKNNLENISSEELFMYVEYIIKSFQLYTIQNRIGISKIIDIYNKLDKNIKEVENLYSNNMPIGIASSILRKGELLIQFKDAFEIDKMIINGIRERTLSDENFYLLLIEKPKYISYINDETTLNSLLNYAEKGKMKIKIQYLNQDFQNSRYILNENIDLGGIEYLNHLDKRIIFENDIIDGLFQKKVNIIPLISKLVELGIKNSYLRQLIFKYKIPYISEYINSYIMDSNILDEEKKFFESNLYKEGKETENRCLKIFERLFGKNLYSPKLDRESNDNNAKIIIEKATSEEKQIIGNYLFRNAKKNSRNFLKSSLIDKEKKEIFLQNLTVSLIGKNFTTPEFDLIINQDPNYAIARINQPGFTLSKLSPESLSNDKVINGILFYVNVNKNYQKNSDRLKFIGNLNITEPDAIITITQTLISREGGYDYETETYREKSVKNFLSDVVMYTDKFAINLTKTILNKSISINGEDKKQLLKDIREISEKNKDKGLLIGYINFISISASENKNLKFSEDNEENNEENNKGLRDKLYGEIEKVSGLSTDIQLKIKNKINIIIHEDRNLTKRDILNLLSELSALLSNSGIKREISEELIKYISKGISEYEREKADNLISDIPLNKVKEGYKNLFVLNEENGKISCPEFEKMWLEFIERNHNRHSGIHNDNDRDNIFKELSKEFLDTKFNNLENEEYNLIHKFLMKIYNSDFAKKAEKNPRAFLDWLKSGQEGDFEDYLKEQNIQQLDNNLKSNDAINNFNNTNYHPQTGTYTYEKNGQKKELHFSPTEINQIKNNPENLEKLVKFYDVLSQLGLDSLWENRMVIFPGISNVTNGKFNATDDNSIKESELIKFLDAILISLGKAPNGIPHSSSLNIEQYIAQYKKYENLGISGNITKDADILDRSKIEAEFMNAFMPQGSTRFDTQKFVAAYESKGESLNNI